MYDCGAAHGQHRFPVNLKSCMESNVLYSFIVCLATKLVYLSSDFCVYFIRFIIRCLEYVFTSSSVNFCICLG